MVLVCRKKVKAWYFCWDYFGFNFEHNSVVGILYYIIFGYAEEVNVMVGTEKKMASVSSLLTSYYLF